MFYVKNSAESVRCGPNQFPTLFRMMQEAADILDVPEPELYVKYDPSYNAYTAGVSKTFITLHSALVNSFTDDELMFIIGHEMGHIKCGHVLYQMMGRMLIPLLEAIGDVTLGMGKLAGMGLVIAFYEWMRQAEFSCDRAGCWSARTRVPPSTATMKLGCGSTRFDSGDGCGRLPGTGAQPLTSRPGWRVWRKRSLFVMYTWQLDHPQVVYRAKGLDEWIKSGAYETILGGKYAQDMTGGAQMGAQRRCRSCNTTVSRDRALLPELRHRPAERKQRIGASARSRQCRSCGSALARGAKFCADCGAPV